MPQENVRLVERAIAAINARDIESYRACCTEDVKLETRLLSWTNLDSPTRRSVATASSAKRECRRSRFSLRGCLGVCAPVDLNSPDPSRQGLSPAPLFLSQCTW